MLHSRTPDRDFRCYYILHTRTRKYKNQTAARRLHAGRASIRNVIVMLKLRHHVVSQRIQDFLVIFFVFLQHKMRYLKMSKKKNPYSCEDEIETSVPRDHRLSVFGKPRDANRGYSGRIFSPILTLMIDSRNLRAQINPRHHDEESPQQTPTRKQEYKSCKAASSFFFSDINAKLERKNKTLIIGENEIPNTPTTTTNKPKTRKYHNYT